MKCCGPLQNNDLSNKLQKCNSHGLPIEQICRQKICLSKSLICPKCQKYHSQHYRQRVDVFFNEEFSDYQYRLQTQLYQKIFQNAENSIKKLVQKIENTLMERVKDLKASVDEKFEELWGQIEGEGEKNFKKLDFQVLDRDTMEMILKEIEMDKNKQWCVGLQESFQPLLQIIQKKINSYLIEFQNIIKNCSWKNTENRTINLQNLLTTKFPQLQQQLWPVRYSSTWKNPLISIQGNSLQACFQGNSKQYVGVLLNRKLTHKKEVRIAFQVDKLEDSSFFRFSSNYVGIGVCWRDLAAKRNYSGMEFQYSGAYFITSQGTSFSSRGNLLKKNPYQKPFQFAQNDIIQLQIEFDSNQLCLRKRDEDKRYRLALPDLNHNHFYPFVCFRGTDQSRVSLISVKTLLQEISPQKKLQIVRKKYEKDVSVQLF